ncbi:FtsX-like permease family protein [Thermoactinospora rubra]|uniref:FtsX-like permease family protein n=1 Tax=Thermoactinospora rubra TaxID=1088767 RepID=UPI000A0FB928|nr:FtsX-like permease family protein [Thermoactinospora rubra]
MTTLRLAREHRGALAVLALLVLGASLLPAALPKAAEGAFDSALARRVTDATARQSDLSVRLDVVAGQGMPQGAQGFAETGARLRSVIPPSVARFTTTAGTSHIRVERATLPVHKGTPVSDTFVGLVWLSDLDRRVRWVEGAPPGPPGGDGRFQAGLVRSAAAELKIGVGSVLQLGGTDRFAVEITGLFEPVDPADRYWQHNALTRELNHLQKPGLDYLEHHVNAVLPAQALERLRTMPDPLTCVWVFGVDPAKARSAAAPALLQGLEEVKGRMGGLSQSPWTTFVLDSALSTLVEGFLQERSAASSVAYLVIGGLLVVAVGAIALAVQLLAGRTERALALIRARGGSLRQVAGTGAGVVALAALPAAAAGHLAALAVPGPAVPLSQAGPAAIALVTVLGAAAALAVRHRRPLLERRADLVTGRSSPLRLAVEATIVVLGAGSVALLRSRGLAGDPLLLLAPLGLTLAGGVLVVRCYPYPLLLLVRLAARRRSAVPFLGLTMAARGTALSALPVLVLLPALAVSVFGGGVAANLAQAQDRAAWERVGADARLWTATQFPPEAIERLRRVPGVERVVAVQSGTARFPHSQTYTMLALDLAAYRELIEDSPLRMPPPPPDTGGQPIPALVPPLLMETGEVEVFWHRHMKLAPRGRLETFPGLPGGSVVVPEDAVERLGGARQVNVVYVGGHDLDRRRLAEALGQDARVDVREEVLAGMRSTPLTRLVQSMFWTAVAAFALYALAAVVLTVAVTGSERGGALSMLRAIGLSARQARRLTWLELAPVLALAAGAGLLAGLALPYLIGSALDLSAYAA